MTDLEITKLCAQAMELTSQYTKEIGDRLVNDFTGLAYNPLHDNAQLIQLAMKFPFEFELATIEWCNHLRRKEPFSLQYEFCGRVANLQAASTESRHD